MKVLFVSSGNNKFGISPIVKAQGESLKKGEFEVEYFTLVGKGYRGYICNILRLSKYIKANRFDLVHSHFFLSSVVATLSHPPKLVVSLMGSDAYTSNLWNFLIKSFHKRWDATIVKSEKMKEVLGLDDLYIIPNGVDLRIFFEVQKKEARDKLKIEANKRVIIFVSNPERDEKNFKLAKEAVDRLGDKNVQLLPVFNVEQKSLRYYYGAADLLLLTSYHEGSPNVIKEAMACNCPIVSTDVGDVKWVMGNTEGCYLVSEKSNVKRETNSKERIQETSDKLGEALEFAARAGRTKGRERIIEIGLDAETVAKRIINIYKFVIGEL